MKQFEKAKRVFMLILLVLWASAPWATAAMAQQSSQKNVTLNMKSADVKDFFSEVTKQTGLNFICKSDLANQLPRVTVQATNKPVRQVLSTVFGELWGYQRTRMLIWMGFTMNFFFVLMGALADWIPGAPYWHGDEGFHVIFGLAPRIAAASFVAFLAGSFMNAYVMSRMKLQSEGAHFSKRAILSTVFGEGIDSVIFFPLAFGGVVPWEEMPSLMLSQVTLKTLYEILVLPVTIRVVAFTKKHDHEDVFDHDVNYNIFNILKI